MEPRAEDLRGRLNDLVSITALPVLWTGAELPQIVSSAMDALVEMLRVRFVFVRLSDSVRGPPLEMLRAAAPLVGTVRAQAVGEALDSALGDAPLAWPSTARVPIGEGNLSIASARLGPRGEIGVVVAGSRRRDFPSETERLLLDVAANQAALGVRVAHLSAEGRRAEDEVREGKRVEEALRSSEHDLEPIIDAIPALAWSARPDGSAEFFNRHYLDYVGLSPERASGWGWTVAVHADDASALEASWRRIIASGEPGEAEARLRRHDGEHRWFLFRANPLRDEKGRVVRWYGVNTDIEDRKRAEAQLRRAYDSFADAQRLSKTGSFIADLQADEHSWSDEAFRIFEFDPATKVTTQRVRDAIHPDDLPLFDSAISRGMSGMDVGFGFRIVTASGTVKHVRGLGHAIEMVDGRPMFVGALQDATESVDAEEALNRARAELARVQRATTLSTLTASIAHEVNQPLSGIMTNANTCLRMLGADPPDVDGARETARRTLRDGQRASDVITHLRALFSNKDFRIAPLDLNAAAREVLAISASEIRRNGVLLRSELAADLPSVVGDRVQLQQVILNLLRNAWDAMVGVDDRPRRLLIKTEPEDGDRVRVTVRDTGVGVDPLDRDKLFVGFFTTKRSGMGIGLSVSRSIVERHGGRLWAEPNDGPGSTFAFSIPLDPGSRTDANGS